MAASKNQNQNMTRIQGNPNLYQKCWVRIFASKDGVYPESLSPGIVLDANVQPATIPGAFRPDGSPLVIARTVQVASYRVVPARPGKPERRFYVVRPEASDFLFGRDTHYSVIDVPEGMDPAHWSLELQRRAFASRDELRPATTSLIAEADKVFADA